jgi:hypothetical protein
MNDLDPHQPNIDGRYRTLIILWAAIFMSVLSFLLFININVSGVKSGPNPKLSFILNAVGILPVAASFLVKISILQKAVEGRRPDLVHSAYVVAFALCEAAALLALMSYYLTGSKDYYWGLGLGLIGIFLHFPQKKYLLAASDKEF